LPLDVRFKDENAPNSISAGAPPQTLLGELTALPRPSVIAGLRGPTSKGREGETLSNSAIPDHYSLPFPKIGGSQPHP